MPLASNNERTATVEVTRPSERLVSPFHGSERLMTLLELSQLLGVPVATLYRWRHRGEGSTGYRMFDTGGRLWRRGSRRRPISGPSGSAFGQKRATGRWRASYRGPDRREWPKDLRPTDCRGPLLAGMSFAMAREGLTDPGHARVTVGRWSLHWLTAKARHRRPPLASRTGRS